MRMYTYYADHPCPMRTPHGTFWNADLDRRLLVATRAQTYSKWADIASFVPGRSAKQCGERWRNVLNPHIIRGKFTPREDRLLLERHAQLGNKWARIARAVLPWRTPYSLMYRYNTLCPPPSPETTMYPPRMKHVATQCEAQVPRYPSFSASDVDAQELIQAAFPLLLTVVSDGLDQVE